MLFSGRVPGTTSLWSVSVLQVDPPCIENNWIRDTETEKGSEGHIWVKMMVGRIPPFLLNWSLFQVHFTIPLLFLWEGLPQKQKRRIVASRFTPLVGLLQFRLQACPRVGYIASVQFQVKAFTGRSFEKGRIMEGTWTKQRQNGGLGICMLKFSYQKLWWLKLTTW